MRSVAILLYTLLMRWCLLYLKTEVHTLGREVVMVKWWGLGPAPFRPHFGRSIAQRQSAPHVRLLRFDTRKILHRLRFNSRGGAWSMGARAAGLMPRGGRLGGMRCHHHLCILLLVRVMGFVNV